MAPEIVKRADYLGPPTDVYALGVVLFTMLCGRFPFTAGTYPELYRKISRGRFPVPPHVSRPGADLLRRMMARDPAERPLPEQCLEHRWFAEGEERAREGPVLNPQQHISTNAEEDLVPAVLDDVASLGVDAVSTSEAVLTRTHNHYSTTYYLQLRRTLFRHRREEVEELGSDSFGDLNAQPNAQSHAQRRSSSIPTTEPGSAAAAAEEEAEKEEGSAAGGRERAPSPPATAPTHASPDAGGDAAASPARTASPPSTPQRGEGEGGATAGGLASPPSPPSTPPSVSRRGRPWSPLRRVSPPGAAAGVASRVVAPPPSPPSRPWSAVGREAACARDGRRTEASPSPPRVITGAAGFGSAIRAKQRSPQAEAASPVAAT